MEPPCFIIRCKTNCQTPAENYLLKDGGATSVWTPICQIAKRTKPHTRSRKWLEVIKEPFYPGFVFTQFEAEPDWRCALRHSAIIGVLKTYSQEGDEWRAKPYVLPEKEMQRLRQMEQDGTFSGTVNYAQILMDMKGLAVTVPSGHLLEGYRAQVARVTRSGMVQLWAGHIALTLQFAELFGVDLEAYCLRVTLKQVQAKSLGLVPPPYERTEALRSGSSTNSPGLRRA